MGTRIRSWVGILPAMGITFGRRGAATPAAHAGEPVPGTGLGYREPLGAVWPAGARR